jgi:hypothetical protein
VDQGQPHDGNERGEEDHARRSVPDRDGAGSWWTWLGGGQTSVLLAATDPEGSAALILYASYVLDLRRLLDTRDPADRTQPPQAAAATSRPSLFDASLATSKTYKPSFTARSTARTMARTLKMRSTSSATRTTSRMRKARRGEPAEERSLGRYRRGMDTECPAQRSRAEEMGHLVHM